MTRTSLNKDWTVRIPVGAYAAALAGSDDPDLRFGAYALPAARKASKTSARILSGWLPHNRAIGPHADCCRLSWLYRCPACADDRASAPSPDVPSGFDPAVRSLLAFFVERSIS